MRFFFSRKGKKNVSLNNTTEVLRAFFFALSLSLFLSLSLSLFVHVIFEGRRERDCFSAAVLLQSSSSLSRGCVLACLCSFSFLSLSVCAYLLKESEEEKKGRKRKKKTKKDGPFFFLSLNQIFLHNTLREYEEDEREEHCYCDYYFYRERAERLQTGRYFLLFLAYAIFSRREKRKERTF